MRLSQAPSALSFLFLALTKTSGVSATPLAKEALRHLGFSWLEDRSCASYCGAQSQYCCQTGEACFTNAANVAYCSTAVGSVATGGYGQGGYSVYTSIWTETDTVLTTSVYTSYFQITSQAATVTGAAPAICTTSLGESNCGTICCASNQRCAFANSCTAYSSNYISTSYTAPVKGTSGGVSTATAIASVTTTQTFLPAATASGTSFPIVSSSNGGLSGGAIAGIVIGVIAGIILLLLICFCCIVRAGFEGLLALLGLGKRRRSSTERVEITEERYSRHGSGTASRRDEHSGWFGGSRPARVTEKRKEKSSGFGGLGMVGAGLLGLAAVLGLKRSADKKKVSMQRSDISSSYYTDSYTGTSASSASSDRRTRRTSDTRNTRR